MIFISFVLFLITTCSISIVTILLLLPPPIAECFVQQHQATWPLSSSIRRRKIQHSNPLLRRSLLLPLSSKELSSSTTTTEAQQQQQQNTPFFPTENYTWGYNDFDQKPTITQITFITTRDKEHQDKVIKSLLIQQTSDGLIPILSNEPGFLSCHIHKV